MNSTMLGADHSVHPPPHFWLDGCPLLDKVLHVFTKKFNPISDNKSTDFSGLSSHPHRDRVMTSLSQYARMLYCALRIIFLAVALLFL